MLIVYATTESNSNTGSSTVLEKFNEEVDWANWGIKVSTPYKVLINNYYLYNKNIYW